MMHPSLTRLLESGQVQSFKDIFTFVPLARVAEAMGVTDGALSWKVEDPSRLTLGDIICLARLLEVPPEMLWDLVGV